MNTNRFSTVSLVLALALFSIHCDESLPARQEPQNFLDAWLGIKSGPVSVNIDSTRLPYPETIADDNGSFILSIMNSFDETLQGAAHVEGKIDIWLEADPTKRTQIEATIANVILPRLLLPGADLTLDPFDSVQVVKQWDHHTSAGPPFWKFVRLHNAYDPVTQRQYIESAPVPLVAQGSFQVFENVPPVKTKETRFQIVYRLFIRYPP